MSGDYLSGSVWFNWLSWMCRLCQDKSSSQPRRQMAQPTQALKCLHLQPMFWSQADVCDGSHWILTRDNDAESRGLPREGGCAVEGVSVPTLETLSQKWPRREEMRLNSLVYSKLWFPSSFDCGPVWLSTRPCGPRSPLAPALQWERICNNKGWKGKQKRSNVVMQQILRTKQSTETLGSNLQAI